VPRRLPLLALIVFGLLCGAWLLSLDPRERFTTDVTELLPAGERDPEARLALSLARERQARVVLVALDAPADTPPAALAALAAAAQAFATSLRASPAFAEALPLGGSDDRASLAAFLHARRFELLLPAWLAEQRAPGSAGFQPASASTSDDDENFPAQLAREVFSRLDERLSAPDGSALAELIASDPLLLLPDLAERLGSLNASPPPTAGRALVWCETRAGPLSEAGQQPVFAALAEAHAAARAHVPALELRYTGVHRFAAAAKASTRAEITRLNLIAVGAVLAVAALLVRRPRGLLHLVPLVLLATLGAATATTALFPRVHVLVFVLGALLSGVTIDYAFHLLLARREDETYRGRLRRLRVPLLAAAGTTLAGFLALTFSALPLVRQLGVYVAAGIVCGLGATLLYLSLLPRLDLAPRAWRVRLLAPPRVRLALLAGLALVAAAGLARVTWDDDLRSLEYPAPALRAEDAALRAAFGQSQTDASFLTRGADLADALERWHAFAALAPSDAPLTSLAPLLPRAADYAAATSPETRRELAAFAKLFPAAAEEAGYEPEAFAPFLTALAAHLAAPPPAHDALLRDTLDALPGPLGLLAHHDAEGAWLLSRAPRAFAAPPEAEGTISLAGIEKLNRVFARYRVAAVALGVAGLAALVLISCALHGLRTGLRTAALPVAAAAFAFGVLALAGQSFGLFHVFGALLGVCLASDYAHFAHADDGRGEGLGSIRLSALTTAASFGVLTLSAIPAVSALGASVALIVLTALLFVETDLFSLRRPA
jgi:predicted exporter